MKVETHKEVQEYYGKTLKTSTDLQTNACCTIASYPQSIQDTMKLIHNEVKSKYYGCGLVMPPELLGTQVLDLGSGSGRDCFILSKLVGEQGSVIGIDMTSEQLEISRKYLLYHQKKFNYSTPNVTFLEGKIEALHELNLKENSFDIIVSNCVLNLSTDKKAVLESAYQLLKIGGEMYFSDVYADRRIPEHLAKNKLLYNECLSGALYWNDFETLAKDCGFLDPRVVERKPISIENLDIQQQIGNIQFESITYRLFKIPELEPACEDYGQKIIYNGTITDYKDHFQLDEHHIFKTGEEYKVCGNTYDMLLESRYQKHFQFFGDKSIHQGIFKTCGTFDINSASSNRGKNSVSSCC